MAHSETTLHPRTLGILCAAFVLAFAVRLVSYRLIVGGWDDPPHAKTDAVEYHLLAQNIKNGIGFRYGADHPPTCFRPPLYPYFLAGVYQIFGESYFAARMVQFVLSSAACLFLWHLTLLLTGEPKTAFFALTLSIFNPSLFYHSGFLLTESIFLFFLILTCWACAGLRKKRGLRHVAFCGLSLALLCLSRSNAVFLLPFLFFWCLGIFPKSVALKVYMGLMSFFLLFVSPWLIRNYTQLGKWTFISCNGGMNFWGANNPVILTDQATNYGAWKGGIVYDVSHLPGSESLTQEWTAKDFDPFTLEETSWRLASNYLSQHPSDIPLLIKNKFQRFWSIQIRDNQIERWAFILFDQALVPFSLLGIFISLYRRLPVLLMLCPFLAVQLSALVFFADTRMRVGIAPSLVIFAALGFSRLLALLEKFKVRMPERIYGH